jgi:predicted alpha/beta superfamily hydrolase
MFLKIDVYFSENCGSYHQLRENLDKALTELSLSAAVTCHTIYYEDALTRNIKGSPSIWINGKDAFESPGSPGIT